MDSLADTYLAWRHKRMTRDESPAPSLYDFHIEVVDIYGLTRGASISRSEDSLSPAVALVAAGFLGSAPQSPSLAISLKTLELFRVLRLHRPSFSVEAFTKTICSLYSVRIIPNLHEFITQSHCTSRCPTVDDIVRQYPTHSMFILQSAVSWIVA